MKRAYVLIGVGVVLLIIGGVLAVLSVPETKEVVPEKEFTLKEDMLYEVGKITLKEGNKITVKFESKKPGAEIVAFVVSEEYVNQNPKKKVYETAESGYLAKSVGEKGELKWTCDRDGTYIFMFLPQMSVVSNQVGRSIQKGGPTEWEDFSLRAGSGLQVSFQCQDSDDQLRVVLLDEHWASVFNQGGTVPKEQLLADVNGNNGKLEWWSHEAGTYYLLFIPVAGQYPVPYVAAISVITFAEGVQLPVPFTYSIEATGGGWEGGLYLGGIMIILAIAAIAVGFVKRAAPAAPSPVPTYVAPAPAVGMPTKFCVNCGAQISADANFCPRCAAKQSLG